jgi:hypothetical protein
MAPKLSRLQIGLGTFVILCGLIGTGAGLYVRSRLTPKQNYHVESWVIDKYVIEIVWLDKTRGDEFAYLVAYANGPLRRTIKSFDMRPEGVYIDGVNRTANRDCQYWIFDRSDVKPVVGNYPPVVPDDFDKFKGSVLWQDYLHPILIRESSPPRSKE